MSSQVVYEDYQPNSQPGFLQGIVARNWGSAVGYTKDIFIETSEAGIKSRFLNVCPDDALGYHGSERGLPRYIGDTPTDHRNRLLGAWDLWTYAGTEYGILLNLGFAGFNHVEIHENADWGSNPSEWWKFWVVLNDTIDHQFGAVSFYLGDGTHINDGHLIGFTTNPPNESAIKKIIHDWKPANTLCAEIILILSGWVIGQNGISIGDGHTIGGEAVSL
jgi:hypothetical protein